MIVRDATPDDLPWINSTWIGGYREHTTDRRVSSCPPGEFFPRWRALTQRLLSACSVVVAAHPSDPSVICGWLCWSPGPPAVVHYLHVRRSMRRLGVATALLTHAGMDRGKAVLYSHRTVDGDALAPDAWLWRPWLLIGV